MRPVLSKLKNAMITRSFCHVLSWSGSRLETTQLAHVLTRNTSSAQGTLYFIAALEVGMDFKSIWECCLSL